jgi:hypothetical protein
MTKVFIGGSRRVTRLNADVRRRLDRIIEQRLPVLIGDANGADKAVQRYLQSRGYDRVEVFCMEKDCRNNVGNWPLRVVPAHKGNKDFSYYATKDRLMASEASIGFMIWDGKSVGTLANVFRLVSQRKKVVVYTVPTRKFSNLKDKADWERFVSRYSSDVRRRIERVTESDEWKFRSSRQLGLL